MRATDLIGHDVVDASGTRVGRVHDLRFELGSDAHGFRCTLVALDCGTSTAVGHRLGYGRGAMAGPWPLTWLFTTYRRASSREIAWRYVARLEHDNVLLRVTAQQLARELRR